jgi:hypothetical protein
VFCDVNSEYPYIFISYNTRPALSPFILINPARGESIVKVRLNLSITILYPSPPSINIF